MRGRPVQLTMTTQTNIIGLSAPVAIEAGDSKRVPTFEATIYTGGALDLNGWDLPVVIDLAGLTTGNVLVANLDHDSSKRVGNFTTNNDGSTLKANGFASAETPWRDEVVASSKNGYQWQASVEVQPQAVEPLKAGDTVSVNHRSITGPVYITRRGILKGFAFVSHGADDNTTVAIAARNKRMSFSEFVSSMGLDAANLTNDQLAGVHANFAGRNEPNAADFAAVAPMIHASGDAVEVEQKRLRQIERATAGDFTGDFAERAAHIRAAAIGGEFTIDQVLEQMRQVRREQFEDTIPMAYAPYSGSRDTDAEVIEAAFALAGGLNHPEQHYSEQTLDAADKMRSSVSLQQLIMAEAIRRGYHARPGETITQGNLRSVLVAAFHPQIKASGFSTVDVANITSAVANKYLYDGWNSVDQTALRISAVRPVKDFKQVTTVSLIGDTTFSQLGAAGELKHGTLDDMTYTNQANTYGVMLAITRQDIINDDLGALTAAPRRIGRGGMLKLNSLVWTAFLNNGSFFTSGRNNLNEGVADMTLGGIAATEKMFINQTDPDGNPLGISPKILLVPPTLHSAALTLMNSQLTVGGSTNVPNANIWQGRFQVESSPYMENSSFTGYSAAAWYLLADPSQMAVIEIAALNGRVEPVVETAEADFNVLGIQMRGYSDVGVATQEYRGGVKADGGAS